MRPVIICLTPVKNEAWILERFLACASLWADLIILADQNSDDGSAEVAKRFKKVKLIKNPNPEFNEPERQKLLIEAAREVPGPRLLVALDADEFLTPNFKESENWQRILNAPEGTAIWADRVNIKPGFRRYWTESAQLYFAYLDDGRRHEGQPIHSSRLPYSADSPVIKIEDIKVMHLQYTDWLRMQSKHRWYLCWERVNRPNRGAVEIYRQYHHMYAVRKDEMEKVPDWWLEGYVQRGVDISRMPRFETYWWDREILSYMEKYGAAHFRREAIWDVDWVKKARSLGLKDPGKFSDPRTLAEKVGHLWLAKTQAADTGWVLKMEKKLRKVYRVTRRLHKGEP